MRALAALFLTLVLAAPALAARQPALGPEQRTAEGKRRMGFERAANGTVRQRYVAKLAEGPVFVRETRLSIWTGTFKGQPGAFTDRRTIDDGVKVSQIRDFTSRRDGVHTTVPVTAPR